MSPKIPLRPLYCKSALLFFFIVAMTFGLRAESTSTTRIELFSPQGVVKKVRQVQVRFSESMVPLGDPMANLLPFEISSSEKGSGRWADSRNWIYDFDRDLPSGIRCEFRLKPGLKSLAGHPVEGENLYFFSTGGPSILASIPPEGTESISEDQVFILELDGPSTQDSLPGNVYFQVDGLNDKIGFRILGNAEQQTILKSFRYRRHWSKDLLLIQAKQQFPANHKVSLVWGKGVSSPSGITNQQDQILPFRVRTPFTATFECERVNAQAACIPITPMWLNFSAPIRPADARKILLKDSHGHQWGAQFSDSVEEDGSVQSVQFKGPFQEKSSFKVFIPAGLKDDSGRKLTNAAQFPLDTQTDDYPPLVKFSANFGILEGDSQPLLPVTIRNVEAEVKGRLAKEGLSDEPTPPNVGASASGASTGLEGKISGQIYRVPLGQPGTLEKWMKKIRNRNWDDRQVSIFEGESGAAPRPFQLPKLQGQKSFEVIGIPLPGPGFYAVEMESQILGTALLGKPVPMYVPTSVLVTNMAVHFKRGLESSLVWVTSLDKGMPVSGAEVEIQGMDGKIWFKGTTNQEGLALIRDLPCELDGCRLDYSSKDPYYVFARKGNDISFVQSTWDEGIERWRFNLMEEYDPSFLLAHTLLDRSLFRAGETVHMKHFLRTHGTQGFNAARSAQIPVQLRISHQGSNQKYDLPLQWDSLGIAESSWQIPRDAKLGFYSILMKKSGEQESWLSAGTFRVEEYRVPLMKADIKFPAEIQVVPREITVDLSARYLAGGMAGSLPVKFRTQFQPAYPGGFEGFEDFTFGGGRIALGISHDRWEEEEEEKPGEKRSIKTADLTLDPNGTLRTNVSSIPRSDRPQSLLGELEFRDPNGEVQTVSARAQVWPSRWMVGLKTEEWVSSPKSLKFQAAVVDIGGKPVTGAPVRVELLQRKYYSSRKRLTGGFYAFDHHSEVKLIKTLCEGKTDSHGLLVCEAGSPLSGEMILQATVRDPAGGESNATRDVWVAGDDRWWFKAEDSDRIDVLPEKKRYEPGQTARFQVRMPFAEATALVTVEREGILDVFVKKISGKNPVIELPIKPHYAPNIYLSALVVRGRVGEVQPTATVDLGRPAYKLGIGQINVGWRDHELKVKVVTDRTVYKVREKAHVTVSVTTAEGKPPLQAELAFAAVDEGLLELMPNASWQLLEAMMHPRGYGLRTITAQMQVIGKRHFGLKALPSGGGGGQQPTRELFDTLLIWKGRVPLNPDGTATLEVPLNDSLTSFKLVAIASAGLSQFGTGSATIRATQDLAIYAGVPRLAREGDRFPAQFTLRNSTDRPMQAQALLKVQGLTGMFPPRTINLAPGQALPVSWEIFIPASSEQLRYQVEVREQTKLLDRLAVSQQVLPAVPVQTTQATLAQVERALQFDAALPEHALPGKGGIQVTLRPTLTNSLQTVRNYMEQYRYDCLEQQISKAVALRDARRWDALMKKIPTYISGDGLAKYFPSMHTGSVALTSYVLSIAAEAGYVIPPEPLQQMTSALENFVAGRLSEYSAMKTADLSIRKMMALEALSSHGNLKPDQLSSITLEPNLWPTSAVIDWFNVLKRMPVFPARDSQRKEAEQILRARLNFQGTQMGFSTEKTDGWWWLMLSPDSNGNRLILSLLDTGTWKEDIPRLTRGALERQIHGIWRTTPANAWGVLAIEKFAKSYESTPPSGSHSIALNGKSQSQDWDKNPKGKTFSFPWPTQAGQLVISPAPQGKPWATIEIRAAIPLEGPVSTGFKIEKTITPLAPGKGNFQSGDLVRIRLKLEAQADMGWVVVNDPIPTGSNILGTGLGRDSQLATQGEKTEGWVWPSFEERSQEAFRAYYEYIPKGSWTVEYTLRLNQPGKFHLPPTRVEALYAPEMFGERPNTDWEVRN